MVSKKPNIAIINFITKHRPEFYSMDCRFTNNSNGHKLLRQFKNAIQKYGQHRRDIIYFKPNNPLSSEEMYDSKTKHYVASIRADIGFSAELADDLINFITDFGQQNHIRMNCDLYLHIEKKISAKTSFSMQQKFPLSRGAFNRSIQHADKEFRIAYAHAVKKWRQENDER